MKKKILFVITSHGIKGETGQPTGYYLSEVTHPWAVLKDAGYEIDFVSPKGGKSPIDGFDLEDPVNKEFWEDTYYHNKIDHSYTPSQIDPKKYVAIFFAGGHGAMWDFPDNKELASITQAIYDCGGVVAAVCHGPAALVNVMLNDGDYLIAGKKINSFTDDEERAVGLDKVVPFLLESKLRERKAFFEKSAPWHPHVVADNRLITGQNPQSAKLVGEALVEELLQGCSIAHL